MKTTGDKPCKRWRVASSWHYMVMRANVKHILRREMKKPVRVRDEDLVNECILTLSYLDAASEKLCRDKSAEGRKEKRSAGLKRVTAYVCLVIMLLSKAVQAGGMLWQPNVNQSSEGASISYGFKTPVEVETSFLQHFLNSLFVADEEEMSHIINAPDELQFESFKSLDEAYEYLGVDMELPEVIGDDMTLHSVEACRLESERIIRAVYIKGENTCKINVYGAQAICEDYSACNSFLYDVENIREEEIAGIKCVLAERDGTLVVEFCAKKRIYSLETNCGTDTVKAIISSLCG